jgi:protein-tyrosine phosphatase
MTQVLDWRAGAASRDVIRRAVQALAAGQLVAFPTETVYGVAASALITAAVEHLRQGKGRAEDRPLTLAIGGPSAALDWVPEMSPLGQRLARRCWPGPVTLVCGDGVEKGLVRRLPAPVQPWICPAGTIGLRVPAHEAILQVMRLLPGPLVLSSANRSGEPAAVHADEVVAALGDEVAVVIDDGPSRFGQASTVVRVERDTWKLLREGVITPADLERQAMCLIVFVCTGNTCRSPMAEALCKKLLAERLGCTPAELPQRGYLILSAGLSAMQGDEAAPEAVEAIRELGGELSGHASRALSPKLAAQADYLIGMTCGHVQAIAEHFPRLAVRPRLLSLEGEDIADPIGSAQEVYRECARLLLRHLEKLIPEIQA